MPDDPFGDSRTYTVYAGQSVSGITVGSYDRYLINFGGQAHQTLINGFYGEQDVHGSVDDTTITGQAAFQIVERDGFAGSTVVENNGEQSVYGNAINTEVGAGGQQGVYGQSSFTVVHAGGEQVIEFEAQSANILSVDNSTIEDGGRLTVAPESAGSITNLHLEQGSVLNLRMLQYSPDASYSVDPLSHALTVNSSGTSYTLGLASDYNGAPFYLSADQQDTVVVTLRPLCFARGTRILTPVGEQPIELLAVGDLVITESGEAMPIVWLGSSLITTGQGCKAVSIRASAFNGTAPNTDLLVTAGHKFLIDGHLIAAEFLVDQCTIRFIPDGKLIEVWHLAVEEHTTVVANGLKAETFYENWNEFLFKRRAGSSQHRLPSRPKWPVLENGWRARQIRQALRVRRFDASSRQRRLPALLRALAWAYH